MEMTPLEINRWNNDDQAIYELQEAHWNTFHAEPKYANKNGSRSRKHKAYCKALGTLERAIAHLRTHTPAYRHNASL
jgi:hypothetical protein